MRRFGLIGLAVLAFGFCPSARAGGFLDPSQFGNQAQLVDPEFVKSALQTIGAAAEHRPYQPATPLGTMLGLDLGIEVALVKIPGSFSEQLLKAGLAGGSNATPPLPIARIHIHKGLGTKSEIGFSYIKWNAFNLRIWGLDYKLAVYQPEEGPTWAFRLCYTNAIVQIVQLHTWSPQFLVSKKVDFMDPYLGVGGQFTSGGIFVDTPIGTLSQTGTATAMIAFLGLKFNPGGIAFALEGTFSSVGAHNLGTKIGLSF